MNLLDTAQNTIGGFLNTGLGVFSSFNDIKIKSKAAEIESRRRLAQLRFEDKAAQENLIRARASLVTREGLVRLGTQALKIAGVVGTIGTAFWAIRQFSGRG